MVGARLVVDLEQRRHGHDGRGRLACQTLLLQPLGQRQREVSARRVAGQHDLFGVVAPQAQPLVGVVAVVERLADGVLRDHPVVDDQNRAVGDTSTASPPTGRASSRRRSETRHRACRAMTRRLPSAGSTPAARTSCALQFGSEIVARTVPGAGSQHATRDVDEAERPRQARSVATDSQSWLDRQHCGQRNQPARQAWHRLRRPLTGAPSLTGNLRGLCALAALIAARGVLGTLLGAVIATTSYAAVVLGVARCSANPDNLA